MTSQKLRVSLLGSGNWGCAIARIVGWNVADKPHLFQQDSVKMYVYEEIIKDKGKLTEIINREHENVKYLPGYKLPENIVATPDPVEATKDADIIVINMPHQVLPRVLEQIKQHVKPGALAISLIKGHVDIRKGRPHLGSTFIKDTLGGIDVSVLMGANVANEVAAGDFCEATIATCEGPGSRNGALLKELFHRDNFNIRVTDDIPATELCGGLKNVIALAAGFCDGLDLGSNAKAAILRVGLQEISSFIQHFFPSSRLTTMFESCGVADLITTSFGGRNRKCAEAFARSRGAQTWQQIEAELLGGQKLQGVSTSQEIWPLIKAHRLHKRLPLMRTIYRIACEGESPTTLFNFAADHVPNAHVLQPGEKPKKVALLGSGNWGTTVATIIAQTCDELEEFDETIKMYVYEEENELFRGRRLVDIINRDHENPKYLPGVKIPANVKAVSTVREAAEGADILLICVPDQYLSSLLQQLRSVRHTFSSRCFAISLLKGFINIRRYSDSYRSAEQTEATTHARPIMSNTIISEALSLPCAVLAGANVAHEIAAMKFAETTLASRDQHIRDVGARLFHLPTFQVSCITDVDGAELISGLCNVIALAAGFCDSLGYGGNTKAAIIRVGLLEIASILDFFFSGEAHSSTLFESCGVADLITMSFGGRNRLAAMHFATAMSRAHRMMSKMSSGRDKPRLGDASLFASRDAKMLRVYSKLLWNDIETEVLGGQYCQGIHTLYEVWPLLQRYLGTKKSDGSILPLPLITSIHAICVEGAAPSTIIKFNSQTTDVQICKL